MTTAPVVPLQLTIRGLYEVPYQLANQQFDAIVSIVDPGSSMYFTGMIARRRRPMREHCAKLLCLAFDDITAPVKHHVVPELHHVTEIAHFARSLAPGSKVLVHCMAGISRSSAAAIIMLCEHGLDYATACTHVRDIRAQAVPNKLMLTIYENTKRKLSAAASTDDDDDVEPCVPTPPAVQIKADDE